MLFIPINTLDKKIRQEVLSFVIGHEVICMGLSERLIKYVENPQIASTICAVFINNISIKYLFGVVSFGGAILHCLPYIDLVHDETGAKIIDDFSASFIQFIKSNHSELIIKNVTNVTFGVNGQKFATDIIKECFVKLGAKIHKEIDYHLMTMSLPAAKRLSCTIPATTTLVNCSGFTYDSPLYDSLLTLHLLYETQEIQVPGISIDKNTSKVRMNLALHNEVVFALVQNGVVISKAQTNAIGKSFAQLGGVCTTNCERGKHYAKCVMSALIIHLLKNGKLPALYVKNSNTTALFLYNKLGFECYGDNKIVYF